MGFQALEFMSKKNTTDIKIMNRSESGTMELYWGK
jgi:hypothetical protein